MNKLIKLLNEWYKERYNTDPHFDKYENYKGNDYGYFKDANGDTLIYECDVWTKKYGFIKRLVDNNKIDFDNRDLKDEFMLEFERYPVFQGNTYNWDFNENGMLMLLSIQEDPISFLINVLKQNGENSTRD